MLAYQKFANYVLFVSSRCAKIVAIMLLAYFVPLYSNCAYFLTHKSTTLNNFGKFLLPHTNTFCMAQDINFSCVVTGYTSKKLALVTLVFVQRISAIYL